MQLKNGRAWPELRQEMLALKELDFDWRRGRLPAYIYYRDESLLALQQEAYSLFMIENALGKARAFPSLLKMERDVIAMALELMGGDESSDGIFTSGGTESLILAVKAARDWARAEGRFREPFRVLASETAHPAFSRAGHLLNVEVRRLPMRSQDFRADAAAFADAIDDHTIMLVGSAPHYPNGVFDPIGELGALAIDRALWLHVDACVGGFLAPFARLNGSPIPAFDLSVPGVSSLSADIHKYGFAAKGASLLLFRHGEQKRYGGFSLDWVKGTYATDGLLGTRPGGAIACAWAVMNHLGLNGYQALAATTLETTDAFTTGIDRIPGLRVVRPYDLCIFTYGSKDSDLDINAVADAMSRRGWFVARGLKPIPSIQIAVNPVHAPIVDEYLNDLSASVEEVRAGKLVGTFDTRTY